MSRLWSILSHYAQRADDNLDRIENAVSLARASTYTADRAANDWVMFWANIAHCWKVTLDPSIFPLYSVEFAIVEGTVETSEKNLELAAAATGHDTYDLIGTSGTNVGHANVIVTPGAGPPPLVTFKIENLAGVPAGVYMGPVVLQQGGDENVVTVYLRVLEP